VIAGHDYELKTVSKAVNETFQKVEYLHCATDPGRGTMWWNDFGKHTGKWIDVIIPAFMSQNTIGKTLASIAMQTVLDKVTVIIVNDSDGIGYSKFIEQFKDAMEIKEVVLEKNGGPGVARQAGIDATNSPYFTCIDADDTFASAFSLEILLKAVDDNPGYHTIVGSFAEDQGNLKFNQHTSDLIWMFGKLYTRAFVDKYKIRFNETRANEDNGFNTIIRLVSSETEKIMFLPDIVYFWHFKPDSITRRDNAQYSYDGSFMGYTDNMIYAISHAKKVKAQNPYIDMWAIQVMCQLYIYYYQTVKRDPRFIEQNYSYCKKYYNEIFKDFYEKMDKEKFNEIFAETLSQQSPNMKDFVAEKTIYQFIEQLKT
jgi:glycosyltransferase involved in cell wall biosynthesis